MADTRDGPGLHPLTRYPAEDIRTERVTGWIEPERQTIAGWRRTRSVPRGAGRAAAPVSRARG